MEKRELELIRSRSCDLILATTCNTELLTFFHGKKILSVEDMECIAAKNAGVERAAKFYRIIRTRKDAFSILLEGLKRTNQSGALSILSGEESEPRKAGLLSTEEVRLRVRKLLGENDARYGKQTKLEPKTNIRFDVLPPVNLFTGRRKELELLHEIVLRSEKSARVTVISQMTSISGLGGIGKTQLARQYVQEKGDEFDGNVIWVNSETEASLSDSFRRLATEKLRISTEDANGSEKSIKSVVEDVFNIFKEGKALFVFDNAERLSWLIDLLQISPKGSKLFMLMTSRDQSWDRGMEVMDLREFSKDDAVEFVIKGLEFQEVDDQTKEGITSLVTRLQFFPLALLQAIAFIHEQQKIEKYTVVDYLVEFETMQMQMLSFEDFQSIDNDYKKTTSTTWSITKAKINEDAKYGKLALRLLDLIAYLNPTNIQRKLFLSLHETKEDAEAIKYAIKLLIKYSMVTGQEHQSLLSIHRLVQEVTRVEVKRKGMEENILGIVLQRLNGEEDDYPTENVEHGLVAWRYAWKLPNVIHSNSNQLPGILHKMFYVGMHDEGISFSKDALEKAREVLGEDHRDCLRIQRETAIILIKQGKLQDSLDILEKLLEKSTTLFGENACLTLTIQSDLASILQDIMGKQKEALELYLLNYKKHLQLHGPNNENTLAAQHNYALSLDRCGRLEEALEIHADIIQKK